MNTKKENKKNNQLKIVLGTWKMLVKEKSELMKILDEEENSELENLRLIFFTISTLNKTIDALEVKIFEDTNWNEIGGFD